MVFPVPCRAEAWASSETAPSQGALHCELGPFTLEPLGAVRRRRGSGGPAMCVTRDSPLHEVLCVAVLPSLPLDGTGLSPPAVTWDARVPAILRAGLWYLLTGLFWQSWLVLSKLVHSPGRSLCPGLWKGLHGRCSSWSLLTGSQMCKRASWWGVCRTAPHGIFLNFLPWSTLIKVGGRDMGRREALVCAHSMAGDRTVGIHWGNPASSQRFKLAIWSGKPPLNCPFRAAYRRVDQKVENLISPAHPTEG